MNKKEPSSRQGHIWKYDPERDIALQTEAVQRDPSDARAYAYRAAWYWMTGDRTAAIADFTQAIRLDSKDARSYIERGRLRELTGDLAGAIADYTRSIELEPGDPRSYSRRSAALKQSGDRDGSVSDSQTAAGLVRDRKQERRLNAVQPSSQV